MPSIVIRAATNGFIVEADDPDIVAENQKPKASWRSPHRQMVCKTAEEVSTLVSKILPTLNRDQDYDGAFSEALKGNDDED